MLRALPASCLDTKQMIYQELKQYAVNWSCMYHIFLEGIIGHLHGHLSVVLQHKAPV